MVHQRENFPIIGINGALIGFNGKTERELEIEIFQ